MKEIKFPTSFLKKGTLRQIMLCYALAALIIPMTLLIILTQSRIWNLMQANLSAEMHNEIENTNRMVDLVLDKYNTILYDFCTDDEIVKMVEELERDSVLQVNSNLLRRELSHVCNRNQGVEGVTLVTESGKTFFYDRNAASFVSSTWASRIKVPQVEKGVVYQDGGSVVLGQSGYSHLLQMSRRIIDYRNINRQIGTVVLTINQDILWEVIQTRGHSDIYICQGNRVVSSNNTSMIGRDISIAPTRGKKILSLVNEATGWTIYDYYSEAEYKQTMIEQMGYGLVYSLGLVVFLILVLFFVMNPILKQIYALAEGMNQVKKGNLTTKVDSVPHLPLDILQIVNGFNSMVEKIKELLEQVKQSAEEQKNAELSAMEAQIDPHFLYNTLDTINWKAIEREEYEISKMVGELADILRYSIRNPGETVSIGQELYWLQQYVMLQKERLDQPLELICETDAVIEEYRVHKLLLQPFVENAIKHGFTKMEKTCRLEIRITLAGKQLHIQIRDNGKGISPERLSRLNDSDSDLKQHVGIANVRKRLELYYGEDANLYFESRKNMGTTVHLFVKAIGREDVSHEDCNN